ncbi:response regulator [Pseudoduganella lutea]|uniref:Response regulator n=1 Tax=Pseudoduganella lutea TaxID=321985 RepID=A0A4P6KT93_9BURK|nr:response regulator [Pseudoduganella lutea]QBE62120.1 response regulator [Pseudoduganella lutea]
MTAGPITVLVVDDERELADLAEALLANHGFTVRVAYSAAEALQVLDGGGAVDALFSDIMMPGKTGLELADTVARSHPGMKIVLTSGYTSPALLAGMDSNCQFVAKPYTIDTVVRLLRS